MESPIGLKEWLAMPENEKKRLEAIAKNKAVREARAMAKKEMEVKPEVSSMAKKTVPDKVLLQRILKKNKDKKVWGAGHVDLSSVGMDKGTTIYWIEGKGSKLIARLDFNRDENYSSGNILPFTYKFFDGDMAKKIKRLINKERRDYIIQSMPGRTSDYDSNGADDLIELYLEKGGDIQNVLNFYK